MNIRLYRPYTPGSRNRGVSDFTILTKSKPEKKLTYSFQRSKGRNNQGRITIRHRGGGHRRLYRKIDFKRSKLNISAKVHSIEYDPNRNARIALLHYMDGEKRYIIAPKNLKIGSKLESGPSAPLVIGNALPLSNIPLGTEVHNIELKPNKGGQIVRAAGAKAQILAKEGNFVTLRLPSKEIRLIYANCYATIGQVSNEEIMNLELGKAGRKRWLGIRPTVRGVVMNPCDHPHGGGEGRAPIGRKSPLTPWGKKALGARTRRKKNLSNAFIVRRRK